MVLKEIKLLSKVHFIVFALVLIFSCKDQARLDSITLRNQFSSLKDSFFIYKNSDYEVKLKQCLVKSKSLNDLILISQICVELSNYYSRTSQYDSALKFEQIALDNRLTFGDTISYINSLLNIANFYATLNQPLNQRIYLKRVEPLLIQHGNSINYIRFNLNYGIYYSLLDSTQQAKNSLLNSIYLSKSIEDTAYLPIALINLSSIYINEESDSALIFLKKCQKIYEINKNNQALIAVYNNLSEVYRNFNQPDSTLFYLNKAYKLLKLYGSSSDWSNLLLNYAYFYKENGDLLKSIYYFEVLDSFNFTNFNKNTSNKIANIEKDYIVKLKSEENAKLASELKRKNTLRNASIITALLLALLGLYQYRSFRQKQKILEAEKELKDQEINQILKTKEVENLEAIIEGRESEQKRIGRDLHDRLGSILSTVKMHFSAIDEKIDSLKTENKIQYEKASYLLDEAVNEVRKIAHDLSSGVLVKQGLKAAILDLKNSIESSGKIKINFFSAGDFKSPNLEFEISIYRIIQELISNILKHAEATKVDIHLTQQENQIILMVEDDGKGFDVTRIQKDGIGIANVRQRVANIGGEINIDSRIGNGCSVIIEININGQ